MADAERDGPVPPAPLVKGPFGDRLPVIRGLLPAWEVYLLVGTGVASNVALATVLASEYVLCPDRKNANHFGRFKRGEVVSTAYYDTITECDGFGGGIAIAIFVFLAFALCAYTTSMPYAEWKALGLRKPTYALTTGQENPRLYESIKTYQDQYQEGLKRGISNTEAKMQSFWLSNMVTWPALVSWDERSLGLFAWTFAPASLLFLIAPVWATIAFVSKDLSETWGPETRWDSMWENQRREVQTPSDLRDQAFLLLINMGSLFVTGTVLLFTTALAAVSALHKGYFFRPNEFTRFWVCGIENMGYYDPTPLLVGGAAKKVGQIRNVTPLDRVRNEQWDGNP